MMMKMMIECFELAQKFTAEYITGRFSNYFNDISIIYVFGWTYINEDTMMFIVKTGKLTQMWTYLPNIFFVLFCFVFVKE